MGLEGSQPRSTGPPSGPTESASWKSGLCHTGPPSLSGTQASRAAGSTAASQQRGGARWVPPPPPPLPRRPPPPPTTVQGWRPMSSPGGCLLRRRREQDQEGLLLLRGLSGVEAPGARAGGWVLHGSPHYTWSTSKTPSWTGHLGPGSCRHSPQTPGGIGGPQSNLCPPHLFTGEPCSQSRSPTAHLGGFRSGCEVAGQGWLGPGSSLGCAVGSGTGLR